VKRYIGILTCCIAAILVLFGCSKRRGEAQSNVQRQFHKDIPVTVEFDWNKDGSGYAGAVAKHSSSDEIIMRAKVKDVLPKEGRKADEMETVIVDAMFYKANEKQFGAELTYRGYPEEGIYPLVKAVIDQRWVSEYKYADDISSDPSIVTCDLISKHIVSETSVEVDPKRSKVATNGRIGVSFKEHRKQHGFWPGPGSLGGPSHVTKWEFPLAQETAVWKTTETCYDEHGNVVYEAQVWRNAGTGLLLEEKVVRGRLPVDYHHYEVLVLNWPF
jgi:hypothetical protein